MDSEDLDKFTVSLRRRYGRPWGYKQKFLCWCPARGSIAIPVRLPVK